MNDDDNKFNGYPTQSDRAMQAQGIRALYNLKGRLSRIDTASVTVVHFRGIGIRCWMLASPLHPAIVTFGMLGEKHFHNIHAPIDLSESLC